MKKTNFQSRLRFCCISLLSVILLLSTSVFAACSETENKPTPGPRPKPPAIVEQDLSMFDTIPHYGIEQVTTYQLSISGDNASFNNGSKTAKLVEKSPLPEIVCTREGEYLIGIKNAKTGQIIKDYKFRMPAEDTEIEVLTSTEKPIYFKELHPDSGSFDMASWGAAGRSWAESEALIEQSAPFTMNAEFSIAIDKSGVDVNGNGDDDYLRGDILKLNGVAGNMSRILTRVGDKDTEAGITKDESYTFTYNFENFGENTISFRFYQAQGSIRASDAVCVNAGRTITLAPGEHIGYKIAFTAKDSNHNIIPMIEFRSDFIGERLGLAMAKENKVLECSHNIQKVEASDGDCGRAGNTEYYGCADCGGMWSDESGKMPTSMTDVTVKKAHTADDYASITEKTHRKKCSVCKGVVSEPENHILTYRVVKEPTDTEKGLREEACDCGYKTGNVIEYLDKSTLTVVGDNGEQKSFVINIDEALPDEAKAILDDKFYNDATLELYYRDTFIMPGHDITVKNFDTQTGNVLPPFGTDSQWAAIDKDEGIKSQNIKKAAVRTEDGNKTYFGHQVTVNAKATTVVMRGHSSYGSTISVNKITYYITMQNQGEQALKFDIGQINQEMVDIPEAKRENVELQAGESISLTFTFPDNVGTNCDALTKLIFKDVDISKPIVFAMAISYKEYEGDIKTLTISTGTEANNFKIKTGKPLPDEAKALLDDKFYNAATLELYYRDTFVMPESDLTVKNFDTPEGVAMIPFGSSNTASINNTSGVASTSIKNTAVRTQDGNSVLFGRELTVNANSNSVVMRGQYPYYSDGRSISVDGIVFHITIKNEGEQTLKFDIGQINGGMTDIPEAKRENVELQAGESITLTLTFPTGVGSNSNALTKFTFKDVDTSKPIIFAMAISFVIPS